MTPTTQIENLTTCLEVATDALANILARAEADDVTQADVAHAVELIANLRAAVAELRTQQPIDDRALVQLALERYRPVAPAWLVEVLLSRLELTTGELAEHHSTSLTVARNHGLIDELRAQVQLASASGALLLTDEVHK